MREKRPKLIKIKPNSKGVTCNNCIYGHLVDAKNDKYYCVPPDDGSKSWLYYGEHSCGNGVAK